MSSRTPEELRVNYGDKSAEWLRANLTLFQRPWKRAVIEQLIREKEGLPEPIRLARKSNRIAIMSLVVATIGLLAAVVIALVQ
jgi:hypothetical protein